MYTFVGRNIFPLVKLKGDRKMKVEVSKKYTLKDILREFNIITGISERYFDLMYKILQFTFAAIIAIVGIGFGFFNEENTSKQYCSIIFSYVLPVCMYVFGIMYTYNAYALALCGKKAEYLHNKLYQGKHSNNKQFSELMRKYVITNRVITLLSYGVPLGFYIVIPAASICLSCKVFSVSKQLFLYHILPVIFLWIYVVLMLVLIIGIGKDHFAVTKMQKRVIKEYERSK